MEGIGWLEARGKSLIGAMEALQAPAAQPVAKAAEGVEGGRWGNPSLLVPEPLARWLAEEG